MISYQASVKNVVSEIRALNISDLDLIFIATKTFHLDRVLKELADIYHPGIKIISTQNGLGTEDLITSRFGPEAVFRMSLNYGVSLKSPGEAEMDFFNRTNYIGGLTEENRRVCTKI